MTDVIRTPSHQPRDPEVPRVDHDEFRQIVLDVAHSRQAIGALCTLLHGSEPDVLDKCCGPGLAVLLESSSQRLQLALEGLADTAAALRIEGVREITTGP